METIGAVVSADRCAVICEHILPDEALASAAESRAQIERDIVTRCDARFPGSAAVIDFTLNELLDNAVRYRDGGDVRITIGSTSHALLCIVANRVHAARIPALRETLRALIAADAGELLQQRAAANAAGHRGSGLGIATLRHDWSIEVGWVLTPIAASVVLIEAKACIALPARSTGEH